MKSFFVIVIVSSMFVVSCDNSVKDSSDSWSEISVRISECLSTEGLARKGAASLEFTINRAFDSCFVSFASMVLCSAQYKALIGVSKGDKETLTVSLVDTGSIRSRCICDREIVLGIEDTGSCDFSRLVFDELVYTKRD